MRYQFSQGTYNWEFQIVDPKRLTLSEIENLKLNGQIRFMENTKENTMSSSQRRLILLRGLPSSGKSYRAAQILAENNGEGFIFSTDEYWYKIRKPDLPEEYSFNRRFLGDAHKWNQLRAQRQIDIGCPLIIIDNTNTTMKEFCDDYARYAFYQDYTLEIAEPTSDWWLKARPLMLDKRANKQALKDFAADLAKRSEQNHRVPAFAIERMIWRWEEFSVENLIEKFENS
jgi:hypothetical protein